MDDSYASESLADSPLAEKLISIRGFRRSCGGWIGVSVDGDDGVSLGVSRGRSFVDGDGVTSMGSQIPLAA